MWLTGGLPLALAALTEELEATGVVAGAPTVGTPALGHIYNLTATGVTATPTVGTPVVGQVYALTATGVASGAPTVGTPDLAHIYTLTATGVVATPIVGTPAVGQVQILTATGIAATPVVSAPSIGQTHVLIASGVTATPQADVAPWLILIGAPGAVATGAPTVGASRLRMVVDNPLARVATDALGAGPRAHTARSTSISVAAIGAATTHTGRP